MDRLGSPQLRQRCSLIDDQAAEMLHDARTAGLVKLHCGKGFITEQQEWADQVEPDHAAGAKQAAMRAVSMGSKQRFVQRS